MMSDEVILKVKQTLILLVALALGFGAACKKGGSEEVVDVEGPSATTSSPKTPAVEPPPAANEKPDSVKTDTKADAKTDDKSADTKSDKGASSDSAKGSGGPAWMSKASTQFAEAFVKRDRDGVYAWAKDRKEIQIKAERYIKGDLKSKKEQVKDMKVFTECLTSGPKFKDCPVKELPVQFSKAGKVTTCDEECCEFEFKKEDIKPKTIFLTKACFKEPEGKGRPGLKAIKLMLGD